jgi:hypothetical protein
MNKEIVVIMKLLARAFLEIRMASYEGNTKASFAISDFVHTIPFCVLRIMEKGGDYEDLIDDLRERAAIKNMTEWLNHALKEIENGNR